MAPHVKVEDVFYIKSVRIIGARVVIRGMKLSVFSCYFPTDTKAYSDQTNDEFYSALLKATKSVKASHPCFKFVVGGDFNATIGSVCEVEKWD